MSQAHQRDPEGKASAVARSSSAPGGAETFTAAAVYHLLGPLLAGRTVLEIWPLLAEGRTTLEQAGVAEVIALSPDGPSLPLAESSVDVVLCLSGFGARRRSESMRWMAELRRVLQPEGLSVFRMQCDADPFTRDELAALVGEGFARTSTVKETPFVGVSFFAPDTDEMAVGGDLARLATAPSHHLVMVSRAPGSAWQLPESLFVPLTDLRADLTRRLAWEKELHAERDDLREATLTLQDQLERREAALAAFRRRSARRLEDTAALEGALETLALERDQLEKRALRAEKALTELEVTARRREVELAAQEAELARLRTRPPPPRPDPPGPASRPPGPAKPPQKNKPPA
jgi:hypothetical protein